MTDLLVRLWPHWLAASLCAGLASANAARAPLLGALLAAVLLGLAGALASGTIRAALVAGALALAGWGWASARLERLDRSALRAEVGRTAPAVVVVTGPARRTRFSLRVPAVIRSFGRLRVDEPALLQLPPGRPPAQGAVLELAGTLRLPRGPARGFDEQAWLRRHGVHVVLRGGSWRQIGRRGGLGGLADRIRARLARTIAPGVGGERGAVIAGMVLGEDEGLPEGLRERFRDSGLFHLLAVSGQNVGLVAGSVLLLAWLAGVPRLAAEIGALGAIVGYVLAVGLQPSVVRAGIAGALASLAWLAARERDRWWFLLVGATVLLAWNPYTLLDPGFQLSFAAVAAIFTLVPRLMRRLEGYPVPRLAAGALAVSAACSFATAPILLLEFGSVPVYSVLSNALAAPAVPPLLWLGLGSVALHPLLPEAAAALAWLNGWLAAYVAWCARLVAGLPHARLTSLSALTVLALAAVLLLAPARRKRSLTAAAACALLVAAGCAAWTRIPPPPPPEGLRISFLDVGQGDAVLLQVPEGAVLVDAGPPEARAHEQLRRLAVGRLAALVLTHPQRDHIGGAPRVLERIPVSLVLDPGIPAESPEEDAALAAARHEGVRVVTARAGMSYRLGGLRLRLLWPEGPGAPGEDPNRHAVVVLASYGRVDALLTADAESDVLAQIRPPPVEVLKVSHHGSADPGLPALLRSLRPRIAVISVGEGNDYGHPAPSTLSALASLPGLAVYRTDLDGRVVVESDGTTLTVQDER